MDEIIHSERRGDDDRRDDDRRGEDRRRSQEPIAWEDRRTTADRRLAERRAQAREDYNRAVESAKAALITHGIASPEFAAAARSTEDLRRLSREIDETTDLGGIV